MQKTLTLANRLGLHARAAAKIVKLALTFHSDIRFARDGDGKQVDGKSIISLMGLGATCGTRLACCVSGPDEAEALRALERLFESRFGES